VVFQSSPPCVLHDFTVLAHCLGLHMRFWPLNTPRTAPENHFQSVNATSKNAWKRPVQKLEIIQKPRLMHRELLQTPLLTMSHHNGKRSKTTGTNITRPSSVLSNMSLPLQRPSNVLAQQIPTLWGHYTWFHTKSSVIVANQKWFKMAAASGEAVTLCTIVHLRLDFSIDSDCGSVKKLGGR